MTLIGAIPRWLILLVVGLLGVTLIVVPHVFTWTWDYGILPELGIAFLISAILAGTIDRWFKADLAKDVFEAAVGHILEPELRQEVHWIAGFKWLSVMTRIRMHIEDVGANVVKVTCDIERELKNISSHPETMRGIISIDDWGIPGHAAEILRCGAIGPDGKNYEQTEASAERGGALTWRTAPIVVPPGKTAKTFSRSVEYKHKNDVFAVVFNWPTRNPELEVEVSPTLDYDAGFSHRAGVTLEPMIVPRKTLQGTFLPNQAVHARWWPHANTQA